MCVCVCECARTETQGVEEEAGRAGWSVGGDGREERVGSREAAILGMYAVLCGGVCGSAGSESVLVPPPTPYWENVQLPLRVCASVCVCVCDGALPHSVTVGDGCDRCLMAVCQLCAVAGIVTLCATVSMCEL